MHCSKIWFSLMSAITCRYIYQNNQQAVFNIEIMNSLGKEKTTDKKGGNVISYYATNLSSVPFMRIYRCMFCNTMQEYIRVTNIEYNYKSVVSFSYTTLTLSH